MYRLLSLKQCTMIRLARWVRRPNLNKKVSDKPDTVQCNSGITGKILHLMVRGSGVRDITEVERISIGKVLRTLSESIYQIQPKQSHYECLEVDELWTFVGNKQNKQWLIMPTIENLEKLLLMFGVSGI